MIIGELKKVLRNKVFLIIVAAAFVANIVSVLYFAETKNDGYYDYSKPCLILFENQYFIDCNINVIGGKNMELLIKDISKSYGNKKPALSNVDITFTPRNLRITWF